MRLALRSRVFPKPFVPMTMNLSSRSGLRKVSISGVRCRSEASKSSATWMSSASTVQARMRPPARSDRNEGPRIPPFESWFQPGGYPPWGQRGRSALQPLARVLSRLERHAALVAAVRVRPQLDHGVQRDGQVRAPLARHALEVRVERP